MALARAAGVLLINASTGTPAGRATATSVRLLRSRISAIGCAARKSDRVVDLRGDRLLPGLINAHDHLQLNSFPQLDYPRRYQNVREWIAHVNAVMQTDGPFRSARDLTRERRLLHGGAKNVLSGVTTVAHHDPIDAMLTQAAFPVRVVTRCGWSHSLDIDGDQRVREAHACTPADWPWIIHAAEGVNRQAAEELDRLDSLGCLAANTLIVHGLALDAAQRERLLRAGAGLIWCPTSTLRLFGRSADITGLAAKGRVALGSDSRLTGATDLLAELRAARQVSGLDEAALESLVTDAGARLLRLDDRGAIREGALADLIVLQERLPLAAARRSDLRMVMIGGRMRFGDADYARAISPRSQWMDVTVDGCPKVLDADLADTLLNAGIEEPGLTFMGSLWRVA